MNDRTFWMLVADELNREADRGNYDGICECMQRVCSRDGIKEPFLREKKAMLRKYRPAGSTFCAYWWSLDDVGLIHRIHVLNKLIKSSARKRKKSCSNTP